MSQQEVPNFNLSTEPKVFQGAKGYIDIAECGYKFERPVAQRLSFMKWAVEQKLFGHDRNSMFSLDKSEPTQETPQVETSGDEVPAEMVPTKVTGIEELLTEQGLTVQQVGRIRFLGWLSEQGRIVP